MRKVDRMAGPRLGFRATPGAIARERLASFVLLCLFLGLALLLVGACNTQAFPPAPPPGGGPGGETAPRQAGSGGIDGSLIGPGGAGGHFGPGGSYGGGPGGPGGAGAAVGGGDGNTDCLTGSFTCVASCAIGSSPTVSGSCDSNGSLICPAGYLRLSTCAPNSCAMRPTFSCCDPVSGAITEPPCGVGGLSSCSAGLLPVKSAVCVPPALGVTDSCRSVEGQLCDLLDERCQSADSALCICEPGDAGLVWICAPPGGPLL